jgi:hypothetical protein
MPATKPRAYQVYDIDWKQAVRALSDSNINLASPGALVIDAVILDPYDRVLLTAQTDATENGIYQVNAAQTLLVPAPDWININSGLGSAVNSGLTVSVTDGAEYAQTTWTLTTPNPVIIGTTTINFARTPDQISNVAIDGTNIELANNASETSVSIRPSGTAGLVGITVPDDATADVANLHIYNLVANGNVKVSTAGGDWLYDTQGDFTGAGNVSAGYFVGNGAFLTGISALGSFIANGTSTVDIGTVDGNVVVTTDGANSWTFDTAGNLTMPGSLVAETAGNTGSLRWEINGSNLNVLKLIPDDNLVPQDRYVVIDPYNTGHIHIRAGGIQDASNSYLYLGGEDVHVEVDDFTKEIRVKTYDVVGVSAYQFSFNNNGSFQSPNGIITGGNLSVSGNVSSQYFIGNGALLTGISAGSSYSNANVANYLPTYAGNISGGNINFVNGSTIKTAVNNVNMNANTGGAVEITTDGGNYTWSYDNYGWMYLPQAQAAYTPVVNGSVLFGSEALVFKAGYANLIFDNTGNTTTANYFLGNVQGLVGNITNLDSLNFAVENISALVANNGVNIGAGGFNNLLVLPTDVLIQNVPLSVAANIIGVTANNDGRIEWMGNSSGDGGGYTTLTLTPDDTVNSQVLVLDPTAPGHIHLRAPGIGGNVEQPTANIFLGPENTNFEITAQYGTAPEARIHSAGNTWIFGNDGNLSLPGNTSSINYANGISILDGYATVSSQYLSNATSQSYNDFVTGNYYNASTLDIDYTAYTGASLLNFDIAYQAPLTANIGISVGAVNAPLIQANANIVLTANSGTAQTWTFDTTGNLTTPRGMVINGNINFLGTDTALLNPADNTPLSLFTSGTNGTVTSFWAQDVGNLMSSNIAAFYLPLQGTQTVRIVNGTNGGNIAIYDFDKDGVFSTTQVSATGNVSADYLVVSGGIRSTGASPAPSLSGFSSISTVSATGNITASGNLIANVGITTVGNVTGNYFIGNGSLLTGLSVSSNYGNSNVANFLAAYGSNTIVTTGNITAGNFIGNISITGNVQGTTPNVTLIAGSYNYVFDNAGNATLANGTTAVNNLSATGNITGNTGGYALGYRDIPQVAFTGNATLSATDGGKHYYSTLSTGNTLTIANNSSVSWTIGTAITVVNRGTGNITIAQGTGVSLYLAGNSTAANRTVSSYGMASLLNVAANVWMINGTGIA